MAEPTNAQLAAQVTATLQKVSAREAQYREWLAGSATGGPNGDGRYPITNMAGETYLLDSLARIIDTVDGPAGQAAQAQQRAEQARDGAESAETLTAMNAALTGAARADAALSRDEARQYRNDAAADRAAIAGTSEQVEAAAAAVRADADRTAQVASGLMRMARGPWVPFADAGIDYVSGGRFLSNGGLLFLFGEVQVGDEVWIYDVTAPYDGVTQSSHIVGFSPETGPIPFITKPGTLTMGTFNGTGWDVISTLAAP